MCIFYLLYTPFLCDTTHGSLNRFRRASRVARPSQGGEKRTAGWASRHEDLVNDGVVAPHVFDHMVVPDRGVVRARCNPPGSAVDACRKPCHDPVYILGDFSRLYGIDI